MAANGFTMPSASRERNHDANMRAGRIGPGHPDQNTEHPFADGLLHQARGLSDSSEHRSVMTACVAWES